MDSLPVSAHKQQMQKYPQKFSKHRVFAAAFSRLECRVSLHQLIDGIVDMIAVYSCNDQDVFDELTCLQAGFALNIQQNVLSVLKKNHLFPPRCWRTTYGSYVAQPATKFTWRIKVLDNSGSLCVGVASAWDVVKDDVASQWPCHCLRDGRPRVCAILSTGMNHTRRRTGSLLSLAVGDGFTNLSRLRKMMKTEKFGIEMWKDDDEQKAYEEEESHFETIEMGDVITIDLDLRKCHVTFSHNDKFIMRVKNLESATSFRLAVSVMRRDIGEPAVQIC